MYKRFDALRQQLAERKWVEQNRNNGRVSGRYLYPVHPRVYAPCGGFSKLDNHPRGSND